MERRSGTIAAVVPAAGYSSRAGLFKPLLPVGRWLVVERSVRSLQQAGVQDIRVVVGHKGGLLVPVLDRLGVESVVNPDYDRGMYSSIQAGVRSLANGVEAFFLLPADCAFVLPETIRGLLRAYEAGADAPVEVVYPVHRGERGHPPLISARLRDLVVAAEPEGGLRGLLDREAHGWAEVQVDDEGILIDLDSEEDYRRAVRGMLPPFPGRGECLRVLREHQVSEGVLDHCEAVAGVACRIGECLNSRGLRIHLGAVMAASLLHDIAKGQKGHAGEGGHLVARLGYPEVAEIIAGHMALRPGQQDQVNETTIVYLADKLVSGSRVVGLDEKLRYRLDQLGDDAARQGARERMEAAMAIQRRIEGVLGSKLQDVLGD